MIHPQTKQGQDHNQPTETMRNKLLLTGLLAVALAPALWAQDEAADQGSPPADNNQQGELRPPPRQPAPPLLAALDENRDGVLSAEEIAKAAESLKKLDRNGDGQIDKVELRPPPQGGQQGPPQDGQNGRNNIGPRNGQGGQGFGPPPNRGPKGPPQGGPRNGPPPPEVVE